MTQQTDLFDRARSWKKQVECVDFLRAKGFKVDTTRFSRDFSAGHIERNSDGRFEEAALLTYANIHLVLDEQLSSKAAQQASIQKAEADADLKSIQAERFKLKLQREKGLLMLRDEHERDLAARALFFKRELNNWPRMWGPALLHLLGASEERLPELLQFWAENAADLTDAWAQGREFTFNVTGDDGDYKNSEPVMDDSDLPEDDDDL